MKRQAKKKNSRTAATGKTATISTKELLQAIDAAANNSDETATAQSKSALWLKLMSVLPELSNVAAEGNASGQKATASQCALERAQRFLRGKFSKRELNAIGIEAVYELMLRFYAELNTANAVYEFYEQFNAAKDAALKLGAPDMMQIQRERSARWLIKEREEGREASIGDAARQFGNEIQVEKIKGGYADVESLCTALNKYAESLGIEQFKDSKRGRPPKNSKRGGRGKHKR